VANEPRLAVESIAGQRPYQEDSVLARSLSDGRLLVAVADGMGGHAAGEVASALALETLVSALEDGQALDTAFASANSAVHREARDPDKKGMGTTLTAALVEDGEYFMANVGDSRGYLLSVEGIRQMTDDHSFVAEAMKRGQTREEAMATPWRDALTRSIGTEPAVEVDVFGPFPVRDDTAFLICSDGLYKTLSDDDLQQIFLQAGTLEGAAQILVAQALDRGSDDNITVALAEFGRIPRAEGHATMPLPAMSAVEEAPAAVAEPPAGVEVSDEESVLVDDPPGPSVGLIVAAVTAVVVLLALLML
jgi:protein phosphatase